MKANFQQTELPDDLIDLAERLDELFTIYHSRTLTAKEKALVAVMYMEGAKKYNEQVGSKVFNARP